MILCKRLQALGLAAVACGLLSASAVAQNETNWHVLSNGFDGIYPALAYGGGGLGGGLATNADGIGTWIPGENLHGSVPRTSDFTLSFKLIDWNQTRCFFTPGGAGPGDWNPFWIWFEADGGNANLPFIFTNPSCSAPGLIGTSGFGPALGSPPGTTASLVIGGIPSAIGTGIFVAPNNGLLPSANGGSLRNVGIFFLGGVVGVPTGCISFTVLGVTTAVAFTDNIDGVWHWALNNPGSASTLNKTYYGFSFNEVRLWQGQTLASLQNGGAIINFPATTAYDFHITSLEASTNVALAPQGADPFSTGQPLGTYYSTTENNNSGIGGAPLFDFNGGYDSGRGASALSLAGATGVPDFNDVLVGGLVFSAQDPIPGGAGGSGFLPTIGFQSWSTRDYLGIGTPTGDERVTWIAFYWDAFFGVPPEAQSNVIIPAFGTRVPVVNNTSNPGSPGSDFLQGLTGNLLPTFTHTTVLSSTYTDPTGFLPAEGTTAVGISTQLPSAAASGGVCVGLPLALSYGSSVFDLGVGDFTWDPAAGSPSGRKVLYLLD